ncbi:MAG: macro domain-containing protein [Nitrospinota bacterium]
MDTIELILVSPRSEMYSAWEKQFRDVPFVSIENTRFEKLTMFDCVVSSANSFGLMDGGVDAAISSFFGKQLMERIQKKILEEFMGEQPVGTSFIIETQSQSHPYLAHTPTMRTPMSVKRTDNVYLAMWSMLLAVRKHNSLHSDIRKIACPALGTGAGEVPFAEAARQMALAYRHFLYPPDKLDWNMALDRQGSIMFGGDLGFSLIEK